MNIVIKFLLWYIIIEIIGSTEILNLNNENCSISFTDQGEIIIYTTNTQSSFQSWTLDGDDQQCQVQATKNAGAKLYVACYDGSTPIIPSRYVVIAQEHGNENFTICEVEVYGKNLSSINIFSHQ